MVLGISIGTTVLAFLFSPFIRFFVRTIFRTPQESRNLEHIHRDALIEFVRNWNNFKPYTPPSLHPTFDTLYRRYLQQKANLIIEEAEAGKLIDAVIVRCIEEHTRKLGDITL
jgi:hypothetical protein